MRGIWQDVRYGLRQLQRSPGFTLVALVTLALGIGANTAIFSVVNGLVLEPLAFPHANRLVFLSEHTAQVPNQSLSYPNWQDWQRESTIFDPLGAFVPVPGFVLTGAGEPEQIPGIAASAGFLPALGVRPALGRLFTRAEDKPGAPLVSLLSYALWQRRFGGDPGVVGRTVDLNGASFTVIGILPASYRFPVPADVYVPLGVNAHSWQDRGSHPGIYAIGLLKPGVTFEQARTQMDTIMARLAQQYPETNSGDTAVVMTLREAYHQQLGGLDTALWVLLAAVGLVLLIACANVANLLLARAAGREREMAVRVAIGAGRGRLARQMLTESAVMALGGGACGLLLGAEGTDALKAMIPADLSQNVHIAIDWRVLLFLLAATAITGLIFGLAPAWHAWRTDVNESLKEGGRLATASAAANRYRQALVAGEFALGVVLVAASALVIRSFYRLLEVNPGFRIENVLTAQVNLPETKYSSPAQINAFYQAVLARLRAAPGVEAAGAILPLPLSGDYWQSSFYVEGAPVPQPGQFPESDYHMVTPGYFPAMGPPLLRGRLVTEADNATAPPVAIVSRSFAERFWPHQDPIGKRIKLPNAAPQVPWTTVVGEVGDTRQYGLDQKAKSELYMPAAQQPHREMTLVVRSEGSAAALTSAVRDAVLAVDSRQPVSNVRTMRAYRDENVSDRRISATLLGLFAALGLALAAVGIYGVVAYTVSLRTHEIGIRVALGASRADVLRMVMGAGARMALLGIGAGVLLGLALMHLAASLLYGVRADSPSAYALAALALTAVALAACYAPARRALRIDPAQALRQE